jgi:hypothetical protein
MHSLRLSEVIKEIPFPWRFIYDDPNSALAAAHADVTVTKDGSIYVFPAKDFDRPIEKLKIWKSRSTT